MVIAEITTANKDKTYLQQTIKKYPYQQIVINSLGKCKQGCLIEV